MLLSPPVMILHPSPYAEIPKQPWNHMLASVNPVTSAVPKIQPEQPDNTEARVYVSKSKVWPYGLLNTEHIGRRVRVTCVYNYLPWGIRHTIAYPDHWW